MFFLPGLTSDAIPVSTNVQAGMDRKLSHPQTTIYLTRVRRRNSSLHLLYFIAVLSYVGSVP